eukprot:GFUD01132229.1.p1 GENE.GFUD01132229.1~~GFUD01132229.1.p1  ORF type:complete len:161 (+),score=67.25 GFUD01132229.1:167-649(+)
MSWFLMNKKTDEKKKKEEVKKQFMRAVSMESDGKLSKDQWLKVLTEAGIKKSTDEVDRMFESKDKDLDGRLSFEEFMGEQSRAERLFKLMDKDGDGFVTKNEFKEVCKNLNREQVEAAFKKFDQTGNEKLNFREFRDMMTKRTENKAKESEPENVPEQQQ